ncbi:MAG: redoxin domain-containing protein [Janthinobacterium lividum]
MKYFVCLRIVQLALLLLPTLALAQSGSYTLCGKVGSPTHGMAYLRSLSDPTRAMDSAAIVNGSFSFKGTVTEPLTTRLFLAKPGVRYGPWYIPSIQLYLEPGTIRFTSPDSLAHANIGGTPRNVDNTKLNHATYAAEERIMRLKNALYGAAPTQRQDTARLHRLARELAANEVARQTIIRKFIQNNPKSPVSINTLNEYKGSMFNWGETETLFNGLAPAIRTSKVGQQCALQIAREKATAVGAVAPDFSLPDAAGKLVSLRDFRGQYVLLDFWASWCSPCRADNPSLVAIHNRYKARNFIILGISLDQSRDWWLKAVADDRLTWPQVSDLKYWNNAAARLYAVESVPQNLLLGPDGRIIAKELSVGELFTLLDNALPADK